MDNNRIHVNSCYITDCDENWHWTHNGHTDYDLWVVFRGEGTLTLNGVAHTVATGIGVIIPPHVTIDGVHDPTNRLLVYCVHFNFVPSLYDPETYGVEVRRILNVAFFRELFDRLICAHNMKRPQLSGSCLEVLLNDFLSFAIDQTSNTGSLDATHIRCISEICNKINESPAAVGSLGELALQYGYSATYLGRLFHRLNGISFSEYLNNARINQAKQLLVNTEMSVTEISHHLGYYDSCYFIRQFKRSVGCTPNAFRKAR